MVFSFQSLSFQFLKNEMNDCCWRYWRYWRYCIM